MSLPVLVAVSGPHEAALVTGLERSAATVRVVRRCADLPELLAAAAAGLARAAIVSRDLPRWDGEALARLTGLGVAVVVLSTDPGAGELGVDAEPDQVAVAVVTAVTAVEAAASATAPATAGTVAAAVSAVLGPDGPGGSGSAAASARHRAGLGAARGGPQPGGPAARDSRQGLPPGRVIAVWGPVGAPGRTTVAVNLAAELAQLGQDVLLVDADSYGPSIAQLLGLLDESAGLGAAVRSGLQGALDAERLARLAPLVGPRLRVLTGLVRASRWPELRPAGLAQVWQRAREIATWTVIDCGFCLEADEELSFDTSAPRRNAATLSALAAADLVLAVGAADPIGLQRLIRGLQELADVVPSRPQVVVTRVRAAAVGSPPAVKVAQALARYAGISDPWLMPDDRAACDHALLQGRTLTEAAPGSAARKALAELARTLSTQLVPLA